MNAGSFVLPLALVGLVLVWLGSAWLIARVSGVPFKIVVGLCLAFAVSVVIVTAALS